MTTIAALLTVHNRKDKTLECLERLYAQQLPEGVEVHTWLVDDGCTDGTAEAVKARFPEVNIIQGDGNLFWNRGMYTAWEAAAKALDYDFYLWLNDDTFVYEDMVIELLASSKELDDKAVISGPTQDAAHTKTTYGAVTNGKLLDPDGTLQDGVSLNGNILLIPRYVFKKIGGMDRTFLHAGGDTEYGWRALKHGIRVVIARKYLGECELHERVDKWCDPEAPLSERWKALYKPTGVRPPEFFYLERKYKGLGVATFHYVTTHLHCLFPTLWTKIK